MGDGNSFPLVCAVVTGNFGVQKVYCYVCVQVSILIFILV